METESQIPENESKAAQMHEIKIKEFERLYNEINDLPEDQKRIRENNLRTHLQNLGMETTGMDLRDMVQRFVNNEAEKM